MVLCVGCYSPAIAPGTPCETSCPGDLVCIEYVCREAGYVPGSDAGLHDAFVPIDTVDAPDGPPGDADADGVTDASDNCPMKANADQHDEDSDAVGDVCDPCPHIVGSADADGDGVGDACDPQPAVAKQRIKFFDPFTSDLPEWTTKTNASRVGETLRLSATGYAGAILSVGNGETRLAMGGTVASLASGASYHQIALSFGRNAAGTVYHYTEFYDEGGTGEIAITRANLGSYFTLAGTAYTGPLPTGAWSMRADFSVATQQISYESRLGGTARAPLSGTAATPALTTSDTIEVGVGGADVRIDYFIVIETVP